METSSLTMEESRKIANSERVKKFRINNPDRWAEIQRNSYIKHQDSHNSYMREYRKKQKEENEYNKLLSQKYKELINNAQAITI